MISDPETAQAALLVQDAQDMVTDAQGKFVFPARLTPAATAHMSQLGYEVLGWIEGIDEFAGHDEPSCMGYLAHQPGVAGSQAKIVIRGTMTPIQWVEDAEDSLTAYPLGGRVEVGFREVYERLSYRSALEPDKLEPFADGVLRALDKLGTVAHVIGHSLGAALASHGALELAQRAGAEHVEATIIASPHVGDHEFAALFDQTVKHYRLYGREVDLVPHVPAGPAYVHFANMRWLKNSEIQADICFGLGCNHHAVGYAAALDYTAAAWKSLEGGAAILAQCIRGPNKDAIAAAASAAAA